ncbi:spermidine synthase [Candidatus Endolissoclinum faulkneri L5]|uniref:Polyamine aminopropyltransferase n=1 Tax=Candidatus Endolissoclinum faulkneri L5 TaxID=1401328 RepID=V9TSG7_9PROT|nr:polyamine aminopropyltransferase [Candidatus Endolissoclinum faulkneri]AHC73844.1 spermidine synthase [Candidatus Endolissoclinum faulkneri L5]
MTNWFIETLHPWWNQGLRTGKLLYRGETNHQELIIFENAKFGRVLALDNVIQTTEGDEFIYHEMMTHVPLNAHGNAKRVLIIGGGDGGMIREVLKHPEVEQVTMVEIDRVVVDMSKVYLPSISSGAFTDSRLELIITNGASYITETRRRFDVIIIDSTDPVGPGEVLFTEEFYNACSRCLTDDGIVVTQNGVPYLQGSLITDSWNRLRKSFIDVWFFVAPIPTYQGGFMAFGWAANNKRARNIKLSTIENRFANVSFKTQYYTPLIHLGSFALPKFVLDLLQ